MLSGFVLKTPEAICILPAMQAQTQIALLGAGNMSEALVSGMLKAKVAEPGCLLATDILPQRRSLFEDRFGIHVGQENREAAAWADVVILSVEPQVLDRVCHEIRPALRDGHLIISVAAGYPLSRLERMLGGFSQLVRTMPNIPSIILEGVTALSPGPQTRVEGVRKAHSIFEAIGKVVEVEERLLDAVTGLSGSGPAYIYLVIEALADGGVKMGLGRQIAQTLAAQTVLGAARMVLETGDHPAQLKDRVASPGGTTITGIHALEKAGFRAALMGAVEAATRRSQEVGSGS